MLHTHARAHARAHTYALVECGEISQAVCIQNNTVMLLGVQYVYTDVIQAIASQGHMIDCFVDDLNVYYMQLFSAVVMFSLLGLVLLRVVPVVEGILG